MTSLGNGFRQGAGLSDHQEVPHSSKQSRQANTNYLVVVHQEQPYTWFGHQATIHSHTFTSKQISVPCPGELTTNNRPPSSCARSAILRRPCPSEGPLFYASVAARLNPRPSSRIVSMSFSSIRARWIITLLAPACRITLDIASRAI